MLQNEVRKAAGTGFGKPGFVHNATKVLNYFSAGNLQAVTPAIHFCEWIACKNDPADKLIQLQLGHQKKKSYAFIKFVCKISVQISCRLKICQLGPPEPFAESGNWKEINPWQMKCAYLISLIWERKTIKSTQRHYTTRRI